MTYVLRRVGVLFSTLLVVSFLVFLIPYATPGDTARKIIRSRSGDLHIDPQALDQVRQQYGLDQPLLVQYWNWLQRALQGDFGVSYTSRTPVANEVVSALGVTVALITAALLVALIIALPLGALAAAKRGSATDTGITTVTQAFVAVPEYWMAPVLVLVFALGLGVLPSAGWQGVSSMVLPCAVLALRPLSYFAQVARASMVDVLESPHIIGARSRGLSFAQALIRHGIRNALLPVITLFSVWLAGLLGGSVVVEVIFAIPGMGRLVYDAVINGDIPVIQASIVSIVGLTILITTATDILYTLINPTVRSSHGSG